MKLRRSTSCPLPELVRNYLNLYRPCFWLSEIGAAAVNGNESAQIFLAQVLEDPATTLHHRTIAYQFLSKAFVAHDAVVAAITRFESNAANADVIALVATKRPACECLII